MANEWRAVLAALANSDARSTYAEVVLGIPDAAGLSPKKRDRAIATLRDAGLIRVADDGALELVTDAIPTMLAHSAVPKREGVHRFVRDGRIEQYPVRPADRRELLAWVVEQAFAPGEELTEAEVGDRLEPFHPDVATLRRFLVDEGMLQRTPSGGSYSRA
ncbi:hypothetical protein BKA04_002014 [Cryobacterium mesophilum]|uniref:DUF2087 domain-containing protein n=1 Tax=Terrimesophilobacter mesophilus TaxID=433647 RepID=A0A4R8VBV8_9MICO|nr:DUF2087 domain-containing protein [Terrimesophilobacter mesophilus]MBB5633791.1 hypothetical protein [Terrimesophilobacter mesophilus]TFB80469.1 DUF2087 domain-containing protein [Terrimesophilobacter mesophilus]